MEAFCSFRLKKEQYGNYQYNTNTINLKVEWKDKKRRFG